MVGNLRALPVARAALADVEHRKGLHDTEALLLSKLKELGYEPKTQEIVWASPAQRLGRNGGDAKKEGAKPDQGESKPQPPKEGTGEQGEGIDHWQNIIVDIPGKELPGEVVLIGAHFDAVAKAPGADDNGTGTAALLELAAVLKDVPLKRTLRLAFFNLEEVGLVGSRQYVVNHAKEAASEKLTAMVSLEMLGYFCLEEGCQKSPIPAIKGVFEPPTKGDTLAAVTIAAHQPLTTRFLNAFESASDGVKITRFDFSPIAIPDILRSDHAPFLAIGVPALMLTDTSNFRNPNYHTPKDAIETLDLDRYVRSVRGIVAAAVDLAEPAGGKAEAPASKAQN